MSRSLIRLLPGCAAAVSLGILGYVLIQNSQAATYSAAQEAEQATIAGNAIKLTEVNASANTAVKFGAGSSAPSVPGEVTAYTGGNSIAIRWSGSSASGSGAIKQYDVYRNSVKVASVTPGWKAAFPELNGNAYVDKSVSAGQAYRYQVLAIDTMDRSSGLSSVASATQPAAGATTAVPTVTFDTTAAPSLAAWTESTVRPFVETWFPKIVDRYTKNAFEPRAKQYKFIVSSSATGDSWSLAGDTVTYTIAASNRTTTAQQQNMYDITYSMTGQSLDLFHGMPTWIQIALSDYAYTYVIGGFAKPQLAALGNYNTSSSAGSYFLEWLRTKSMPTIIEDIARDGHNSIYSPTMFLKANNKTLDQSWAEMTGRKVGVAGKLTGSGNFCVQTTSSYVKSANCHGYDNQGWRRMYANDSAANFQLISADDLCLAVENSGTAAGTKIMSNRCGSNAGVPPSLWKTGSNNSLVHVASNRCLQYTGGSAVNGAALELGNCSAATTQQWFPPADTATPPTPSRVRAFTGGSNIALNWNVPANPYVRQYNVYRNNVKIGVTIPNRLDGPAAYGTAFTDNNAAVGTNYSYQIQAIDNLGTTSSLSTAISASRPSNTMADPALTIDASVYQNAPELVPWLTSVGMPLLKTWYAKASNKMAYPDYTPPNSILIKAETEEWFQQNFPDWAAFVRSNETPTAMYLRASSFSRSPGFSSKTIVHESIHNIQVRQGNSTVPTWFLEGAADYYPTYAMNAAPEQTNTPIGPNSPYGNFILDQYSFYATSWYGPAALMLDYIIRNYDSEYLRKMTVAVNADKVPTSLTYFSDGRNLDQAFKLAAGQTARVGTVRGAASQRCLDVDPAPGQANSIARIADCTSSGQSQKIGVHALSDGFVVLTNKGMCLNVNGGKTDNSTAVYAFQCRNELNANATLSDWQKWKIQGSTIRPKLNTAKCVEPLSAATASGTRLQLNDCNGSSAQNWTLP